MSNKKPTNKGQAPQPLIKPEGYPFPIKLNGVEQEQLNNIRRATGLQKTAILHAGLGYSFSKFLSGEVNIAEVIMGLEDAKAAGK